MPKTDESRGSFGWPSDDYNNMLVRDLPQNWTSSVIGEISVIQASTALSNEGDAWGIVLHYSGMSSC